MVFFQPIESNLAGWVAPLYKVSKYEIARSSSCSIRGDDQSPEGYFDLVDINTGKSIELSKLIKPHIEMVIKEVEEVEDSIGNRSKERVMKHGKLLKSNIIQLNPLPTLIAARMSRTQRNTIVVDWNLVDMINCVKKVLVYEHKVQDWSYMPSYLYKVENKYRLVTEAELDRLGCGRYVFQDDIGIRVLTDRAFYIEAIFPDGRKTEKVKLEAAPELLLKASIDPYGVSLLVELVGDEDDDLDDENCCMNNIKCLSIDTTPCCELFGMSLLRGGLPEIRSRHAFYDDTGSDTYSNSDYRIKNDGIREWNGDNEVQEFSSGFLRLPAEINLIHMSEVGRVGIKLYRDQHDWNKYRLVDKNGVQIPYRITKSGFIEAKLTDGVTYASSDAIETSPMPPPPELEITISLRNPRNPNILMVAQSNELWSQIASVYLYYETTFWTRKSKKITLVSDKKNSSYSNTRRFKLPADTNLRGVDYEIIFTLPDGREWFRKSELKPFEIEVQLEGLLNFLKLFQVIKDSDLIYVRQFLLFVYRWRLYFLITLAVLIFQVIVNFPLIGPFICSVVETAVTTFFDITLFFLEKMYSWSVSKFPAASPLLSQLSNEVTILAQQNSMASVNAAI